MGAVYCNYESPVIDRPGRDYPLSTTLNNVFEFTGKMELSTWNTRADWKPIRGKLWAADLAEAVIQLRGWITNAAAGKSAYYVVRIGGQVVRDSTGPNT